MSALPPLELPARRDDCAGLVVGVPAEYFPDDLDAGVRAACDRARDRLRDLGAEIRPVSLPNTADAVPAWLRSTAARNRPVFAR